MIKYLNPISKFAIDDNTTSQIIIQAYDYYKDKVKNIHKFFLVLLDFLIVLIQQNQLMMNIFKIY